MCCKSTLGLTKIIHVVEQLKKKVGFRHFSTFLAYSFYYENTTFKKCESQNSCRVKCCHFLGWFLGLTFWNIEHHCQTYQMKKNIEVLFKKFVCALCASMKACMHISLKENVYLRSRFNELCCREVVHDSNVDVFLGTGDDVDDGIPIPLPA